MLLYALVVIFCYGAMYLTSLIPTAALTTHVKESAQILSKEGNYPYILLQKVPSFQLDNFSESLILNHSYYMDSNLTPSSVLLNSAWRDTSPGQTPVGNLAHAVSGDWIAPNATRSRYWMGFRTIIRPLLALTDIQGIRRLAVSAFFSLFFICVILITKKVDVWCAAAFGLSIMAIYPFVVSVSLQYSCDFLLAFLGIIAVLLTAQYRSAHWIIFLLLGQLTQYFDFYTTPILTWGMPFLVLYALRQKHEPTPSTAAQLRLLLGSLTVWLLAYGGMWFIKMILTTVGSTQNGFSVLNSFLYYTGIDQSKADTHYYTLFEALTRNFKNIISLVHFLFYGAFALCAAVYAWFFRKRQTPAAQLSPVGAGSQLVVLLCAAVPVIWLSCSRQASGFHSWFQYRTLTLAVFAGAYWWYLFMRSIVSRICATKRN